MLRSLGTFLLLALVAGAGARAETGQARFLVSATVPERVMIESLGTSGRIVITADDVRRGYKDVSARFLVGHSTKRGWVLQLSPRIGITEQIKVRGLSTEVVLREESVEVYRPANSGREDISLGFHMVLDADAEPGTYDLPVHVAAMPL